MQSNKSRQQLHCIVFLPTGLHKSPCFDISPILSYTTNAQLKETRKNEPCYTNLRLPREDLDCYQQHK